MKRHSNLVVNLVALLASSMLVVGATMEADAEPISIAITAEVAYVDDPGGFLGGAITVGDVITGTYRYESTTPDTNPLPTVGDYWHTSAPFGITLIAGGLVFRTDPNDVSFIVEIVNDYLGRDNYLLRSYSNVFDISVPSETSNHISWQLDDPTQTALSTEALPTVPPVLADWQSIFGITIESRNDYSAFYDDFFIRAHVTSAELIEADTDGDGVPDNVDQCPNSDLSATVIIGDCNSGVTNTFFTGGCTISDRIVECAEDASTHGRFMSCASQVTNVLKADGAITGPQKGALNRCAAKADIP